MATQRLISTNFWKDSYVIDLDPTQKLLFLYFLTNPNTTLAGVYEINLRQVAFDTGIDRDMVEKILQKFCEDEKMYFEKNWLILSNFVKHQRLNPSIKKGILKAFTELPTWLQAKIKDLSEKDGSLPQLLAQSDDSLGPDWGESDPNIIKYKEKKYKETKRKEIKSNAPTAPDLSKIDNRLAAKEQAARNRKTTASSSDVQKLSDIFGVRA